MPRKLTGKHNLSDRKGAPFVGYWQWSEAAKRSVIFSELHSYYEAAIVAADAFRAESASLKAGGKLTEKGIHESLLKRATKDLSELRTMQNKATAPLRRDIEARKARMVPVKIDRTDFVGEMQRREVRDRLMAMKAEDRHRAVLRTEDNVVIDAVLSAPRMLIDLPDSALNQLTERRLSERYGDELAVLNEIIDAADTVDRAFEAARDEMRHEAGIQPMDFVKLRNAVEQPIQAEWERGFGKTKPTPEGRLGTLELAATDEELAEMFVLDDFREKFSPEPAPDGQGGDDDDDDEDNAPPVAA